MKSFIITFFTLMSIISANEIVHLEEISKGKLIHGEAQTVENLKGKVVLFEYWGYNWPPCIEALPHLQVLQDKFGKTGKFQVIASHVVPYNKRAIEGILKKTKVKFPVYQSLILSKAKPTEGIPFVVLFDQNGKIVEQDFEIEDLKKKIENLIKNDKK